MKKCKLFCAAAIFSVLFSVPAFAGDIQTPTIAPPPPPVGPNSSTDPLLVPGEKESGTLQTELSSDLIIEVLLGALSLY